MFIVIKLIALRNKRLLLIQNNWRMYSLRNIFCLKKKVIISFPKDLSRKKIQEIFNKILQAALTDYINLDRFIIAYHRLKNLRNLLTSSTLKETRNKTVKQIIQEKFPHAFNIPTKKKEPSVIQKRRNPQRTSNSNKLQNIQ